MCHWVIMQDHPGETEVEIASAIIRMQLHLSVCMGCKMRRQILLVCNEHPNTLVSLGYRLSAEDFSESVTHVVEHNADEEVEGDTEEIDDSSPHFFRNMLASHLHHTRPEESNSKLKDAGMPPIAADPGM